MPDFVLTVEMKMTHVPESEGFRKCVTECFANYVKEHPENEVILKYMHLKFAEQTLAREDMFGRLYLPDIETKKRCRVKRIKVQKRR